MSKPKLDPSLEKIKAEYDDEKEFILDPAGYFLIRINKEKKEIEVGFCKKNNVIEKIITGKKPKEIYQTILKYKIISRADHAAYLGKELQKAYTALQLGIDYVQDEELKI